MKATVFAALIFMSIPMPSYSVSWKQAVQEFQANDPSYQATLLKYEQSSEEIKAKLSELQIDLTGSVRQELLEEGKDLRLVSNAKTTLPDNGIGLEAEYRKDTSILLDSQLVLTLTQSLWRNGFGEIAETQEKIALLYLMKNQLELETLLDNYWFEIFSSLTEIQHLQSKLELSNKIYQETQKLNRYVSDRYRNKIALESEFLQAEIQSINNRTTLTDLKSQIQTALNVYQLRLKSRDKIQGIIDLEIPKIPSPPLVRSIAIAELEVKISKLEFELVKNNDKPLIDLALSYTSKNQDNSTDDYISAGFNFDIPVINKKLKRDLAAKRIAMDREVYELELAKRNQEISVTQLNQEKQRLTQNLSEQQKTLKLYRRIYKEQLERYGRAALSFDLLINTQKEMHRLSLNIDETKFSLKKVNLSLLEIQDQLVDFVKTLSKSKT